ncbi:hypothetical protein [Streptomyces sp. NPDC006610]|jgi:type IV secretory pathway TrbD component|uniref:hypothetical protein n=1 Tax=Streptomyces sp. NPDC006610 TaxID=3154584 RepID=UPI0033A1F8E8
MGIYLVDVGAREWCDATEDGMGEVADALDAELRARGLPPYDGLPEQAGVVRGSGLRFEEKLIPPMDGFAALCRSRLSPADGDFMGSWSILVPLPLEEAIRLPVPSAHDNETVVAGAPRVLALMERLAAAVALPVDALPAACDNLDLTMWFREGGARRTAAARPGPWAADLDAAFYVALYLRAAQHSLRRGCPLAHV